MQIEQNLAVCVPIEDAENIRCRLLDSKILDTTRKIKKITKNGKKHLLLPVIKPVVGYTCLNDDMPEFYLCKRSLKDYLSGEISEKELEKVPSSWQVIGQVVVINIPEQLDKRAELIGQKLLQMYPRCTCVVRDKGIHGPFRLPVREIIAGHDTETVHKENGCVFKLDVTKVMYSKGNLAEKKLMSISAHDEVVVDMFAGIGYFSIPIAVHSLPKKVISIELNPVSFDYLRENIYLNHVENLVEPMLGDCALVTPEGIADRVIMGYVGNTHHYLIKGMKALKPEGGILHYHETTPEKLLFERPINRIKEAAMQLGKKVKILETRRVKKYAPCVWHVVVDVMIK
ncbi:MAG: class I SAM-dependent methyltransferase family protein [Methanomethylovorans sp.]|jgi:tRNA wybutosine-synthesizing protein 2|nr:class I SAM-dependent methyltransferase family protein [Methanomethylovorans sp.]